MGRLLFLLFINLAAWLVLRKLWPGVRRGWRQGVVLGLMGLSLATWAVPLLAGYSVHSTPAFLAPLKLVSVAWTVASAVVLLAGLPFALVRLWVERRPPAAAPAEGVDPRRRSFLLNVGRAVPVMAAGAGSVGVVGGSTGFKVREVEVKLRGLPAALDGFRIGQITDIHVGPFVDADYLRGAVEAMNSAGVDLQVMTGDLIDDLGQLDETMEALAATRARHGMLAILGNHEHWRGLEPILEGYEALEKRAPVRLLVDQAHVLEHAGHRVRVVGVDYPMTGRSHRASPERWRRSADEAFRGASSDELTLCLSHHPDFFPYAAERGARLTLSGHTHGGQVAVLGVPLFSFAFKYMLGRYRFRDSHLYVSGGTGHWLPFRLGVPPEVTLLTLRAVDDDRRA